MEVILIKSFAEKPWRSPETYQMIEDSLRERWAVETIRAESEEELREGLISLMEKMAEPFVFNIAEFVDEKTQTGFIPAILDEVGLAHLGSDAKAIAVGLDKAQTKMKLKAHGIPTPDFFVLPPNGMMRFNWANAIGYPLFVKPLNSGGHVGVSEDSIVHTAQELETMVEEIHRKYQQAALVEKFIDGDGLREFSAGVVGNDPYLFTPVEIDFDAMPVENNILSFDAAQKDLEVIKPVEKKAMREKLNQLALATFEAVGAKDYSRIDLRMDDKTCYVLEINTMPGLGPHSFLPEAMEEQHNLGYAKFIQKLVEVGMVEHGGE